MDVISGRACMDLTSPASRAILNSTPPETAAFYSHSQTPPGASSQCLYSGGMDSRETVQRSVVLPSTPARVWTAITDPERLPFWMADFPLTVAVTWMPGTPLHMTGDLHGLPFENRGTVLEVVPLRTLRFTYWTSLSGRPYTEDDIPVIQYALTPEGEGTRLELVHGNVPSGPEHQHLPFYWNAALLKLGDLLTESGA